MSCSVVKLCTVHTHCCCYTVVYITEDPEYDGGSSAVEYLVTMTGDMSGTRDVYRGHDTQCTVASLLPGRLYTFQVKACNKAGVCTLSLCCFHCSVLSPAVVLDCITPHYAGYGRCLTCTAVLQPVPIRHHFHGCESAAGTCFAC